LPTDDFYTPTDVDTLRMENELLAFEVRFLKARFAEPERFRVQLEEAKAQLEEAKAQLEEAKAQLEEAKAQLEEARAQLEKPRTQFEDRFEEAGSSIARLEGAEADLILLLRRLARSPAGWLFRRKPAFRELERRYLNNDA
jgi:chromosome segregation ATPase